MSEPKQKTCENTAADELLVPRDDGNILPDGGGCEWSSPNRESLVRVHIGKSIPDSVYVRAVLIQGVLGLVNMLVPN